MEFTTGVNEAESLDAVRDDDWEPWLPFEHPLTRWFVGILVDWLSWYEKKHGDPPSAVSRHEIPASELEEVLRYQGTTARPGDILIVRSGYVRWHNFAAPAVRKLGTQDNSTAIGVQNNEATVRWLYDHHFAAVAGDTVAFEAWPPPISSGWCLHEWLLVQFGTPIGEVSLMRIIHLRSY